MSTENGNQLAFPANIRHDNLVWIGGGLTKREYFAAMAMQGLCAGLLRFGNQDNEGFQIEGPSSKTIAEESIKQADALLTQLNTKQ